MSTALESALRRDRALVAVALSIVVLLCWAWIVPMARDMYGPMTGPSAWMMTSRWDAAHVLLLFAMWTVMMAGMMLPSVAPTLLTYAGVVRKSADGEHAPARVYAFAGGYIVVWTLFSAAATLLQRGLHELLILSPMMELRSGLPSAAVLLLAGVYQLTPFKRACLESCRSPVQFIVDFWRPGAMGAFRMGIAHGLACLGCCWALMLLLFAGGVMNLYVIAALTVFVLLEKMSVLGRHGDALSGGLLIALAAWVMTR